MLKASELRGQSQEELQGLDRELCEAMFALRNQREMDKKLEAPHLLREKRRDRARVLTILREKERVNA